MGHTVSGECVVYVSDKPTLNPWQHAKILTMTKTSTHCAAEILQQHLNQLAMCLKTWSKAAVQAAEHHHSLSSSAICIANQDNQLTITTVMEQSAAVNSYSDDMMPPFCWQYEFNKQLVLTYCIFKLLSIISMYFLPLFAAQQCQLAIFSSQVGIADWQ